MSEPVKKKQDDIFLLRISFLMLYSVIMVDIVAGSTKRRASLGHSFSSWRELVDWSSSSQTGMKYIYFIYNYEMVKVTVDITVIQLAYKVIFNVGFATELYYITLTHHNDSRKQLH